MPGGDLLTGQDVPLTVALEWIPRHCVVPDGFRRGAPFVLYDSQLLYFANFYTVRGTARWVPENPILAPAFRYRRGLWVDPQKKGKGPGIAAQVALEGVGPALFAGWAESDEGYVCAENGCGCGWEYPYEPGEPKGMRWPTPLIQITAFAEDQTENIYRPLRSMIRLGPLSPLMRVGEKFTRIVDTDEGRIDVVTSSAQARLGAPLTFCAQDEVGLWTASNRMTKVADTQYRGLAGMGGRASLTTNAWNPAEGSVAQREYESSARDVYRQFVQPPATLSFKNKAERRRLFRIVYADTLKSAGGHVDIDAIDAEAVGLMETDPAQSERFFGNRIVYGAGSWLQTDLWQRTQARRPIPEAGTPVCLGFDGSLNNDWTTLRAETMDGWQFTPVYGPDRRPTYWNPAEWNGQIPRGQVRVAVEEIFETFDVALLAADPEDWETQIEDWALQYGERRVIFWRTNRVSPMYDAIRRFEADLVTGALTHDDCPQTGVHVANAQKLARPGQKYVLAKPNEQQKIDLAMSSILAHEAAADSRASGWTQRDTMIYTASSTRWR